MVWKSRTSTTGCVVRRAPDAAPDGCVSTTSRDGAPAVTVMVVAPDVAAVPPLPLPIAVAVIVVEPTVAPVTSPLDVTVATFGDDDVHENTVAGTTRPRVSV